ncbi:MAG: TonB-dependent receptor, partial [Lentisphaeraceae bacterium]|nr:TonB-dependent receptor [Lentisphaeraceae bacterium]
TMNNSEARYAIRHTFAEVSFQPQLSETLFLENRLWYDDKSHRQENTKAAPSGATTARDPDFLIRSDYQSYGLESILKFKTYKNTFLLGGSFEQNRFPGIFERLADANNGIPSTPFFLSKKGNENLIAFFAEDEFRPNEDWIMTLGLRYDEDDFRTNEQSWSPRFALLHRLNEEFSLKYSFNSGFVRPTLYVNRASIADRLPEQDPRRVGTIDFISGANKGQTVQSHDLQASYHDDSTLVTLTLFYTTVEDYIVERAKTVDIGSDTYRFIAFNGGEVTSKGLELEWYQGLTESLSLYMNYSYAMGKFADKVVTIPGGVDVDLIATKKVTDGKRIAGPPVHIWNLGFEYFPTDDVSMNLHYRGWADTQTMTATTTQSYSTYGPQPYVDFTLHIHNFLTPKLKLQLYIKNIFDNENGNHQDAQTEIGGREGGIALSYVF